MELKFIAKYKQKFVVCFAKKDFFSFQDLRQFFFGNAKEQNQRRNLLDNLTKLVFPFSISKADIANPSQFFGVRDIFLCSIIRTDLIRARNGFGGRI